MFENEIKTTCSYCGVGCGILVSKTADGKVQVKGDPNHPVNKGMLCSKGMNLHYVVNDTSDRLLYPQMRPNKLTSLERVSWDKALSSASNIFKNLIEKYGPDSVGFYVSGQCLTEEYYIVNKLTKGFLGTNNIDTNSRLCMSSAVIGYKNTFGEDSVPISYDDIELADCFLISGANPAWCHPILFRRIENHKESNTDVKVIVVDPRKTDTASFADLHLQILPGTDIILNNAIGKWLIDNNKINIDFIINHTENFELYKKQVQETSLSLAAKLCGISLQEIEQAANIIGNSKAFISMWAMGLNQSSIGTYKNYSLLNLSLLTGQIGKPGSGPFSLTGQPNAMGGREVGGMASLLAVHKDLSNAEHRNEVAKFWGVQKISANQGYTATEMFDALENGKMKAIWIICTNPSVSMPNANKIEKALKRAEYVIVQDISNKSDTLQFADLILPAAGWLEKEGTITNSERRISYLPKIIDPPKEAKSDVEILCEFAKRMGFDSFNYDSTSAIYDEYCSMTKGTNIDVSHLNYTRLQKEGTFQWPVLSPTHKGTPRLFSDKEFYTSSKRAIFNIPSSIHNISPKTSTEFPLILTTGRIRDQWHTMTKTGKVARLTTHYPTPVLEIHKYDAEIRQIKSEDIIVINSKNGQVRGRAKVTNSIKQGVVFFPMHWGKVLNNNLNRANNLSNSSVDPFSKEPDFKYTPVSVKKYHKPKEEIIVVGAGAAAFRFIQNYRDKNTTDSITVFSKEQNTFYNRVLLPEYISEELNWEQLKKVKKEELEKLNIVLYQNTTIVHVDKSKQFVKDKQGNVFSYDKLILATGSRPFIPSNILSNTKGLFSIRSKSDADTFKAYLNNYKYPNSQKHVTIVGGGLLGLEMASILREQKIGVDIIQRSDRLMKKQLDNTSSKILRLHVEKMGIKIYFSNEVSEIKNIQNHDLKIKLKNNGTIHTNAIIYAIGTQPNVEFAKSANLKINKGIVVNEFLQSTDANIFAIGEIAEFKSKLYGITSAVEEQASKLANFILGDINSIYKSSADMNILKFKNLNLCSIGTIQVPEDDDNYEEIIFSDIKRGYYKKCVVKNDILIGAILIGDKNEFAEFKALIENKTELADKRNSLLSSNTTATIVKGKLICSCGQVGEGNLIEAIQKGAQKLDKLCKETGAGLGCGSCKPEIRELLKQQVQPIYY
ncbi:molybdopterin-dependent oxidoreductase [Tenacibaculum xiamenense]|uniref:molybdopterin-dependent oxidoreductase n=1 Tax=Tenacibaculum xiamenense TaxID=1261553 RepID=UPI0038942474